MALSIVKAIDFVVTSASSAISLLIIVVYIYDKELRRLPSSAFLTSFVATTLLVSSAGLLIVSTSKPTDFDNDPSKFLVSSSYFIFAIVSYVLSLAVITLDRYLAIVTPLRYSAIMNWSKAKRIVCTFWFGVTGCGIVTIVVAFVASKEKELISNVMLIIMHTSALLGLLALIFVNSIVLREVRRQVKLLQSLTIEQADNVCSDLTRRETRTSYLCFGTVATFLFCWLPNAVSTILRLGGLKFVGDHIFVKISTTVFFLAFVLNLFWYIFWKKDFRYSLRRLCVKLLCCRKSRKRVNFNITTSDNTIYPNDVSIV